MMMSKTDKRQITRRTRQGIVDVCSFSRSSGDTHYMTARATDPSEPSTAFQQLADVVREREATIVSQTVFGDTARYAEGVAAIEAAFGKIEWPVTWLDGGRATLGTQVSALTGTPVDRVRVGERIIGSEFEDDSARYCFLGDLMSEDATRTRPEQVRDTFEKMERLLADVDMGFDHVIRTWLYIDRILDWYDELNEARTAFFAEREVCDHMMPASTGIGVPNPRGRAVVAECIGMVAKRGTVNAHEVDSPLQCAASDYRSSFSRAVEVVLPDHRRLYVSGTASIGEKGDTVYLGSVEAQIERTMEVVQAILESRGMSWESVSRGVAYFKDIADLPVFSTYCEEHGIPRGVLMETQAVVCRDDLLFELEANAVTM
jgi:enamine deaminase RidA (YjgF/YER057c/UK114 family)